jgi:hypothetical protein
LRGIALIAVLLFAFITGLHLNLTRLWGCTAALGMVAGRAWSFRSWRVWAAGYGSSAAMAGERASFGLHLCNRHCTSVTAMPVLGAILHEMDLLTHHITTGTVARSDE